MQIEQTPAVILRYLDQTDLPLRKFAEALTVSIRNESLSHVAVMRWRDGLSEPDTDFLTLCLVSYPSPDWRFHFALDCLASKRPEIWAYPNGGIWPVAKYLASREP
jgi:hypothetical protein